MDKTTSKTICRSLALIFVAGTSTASAVEGRLYQLGDGGAVAPHVGLEFGSDNNPFRSTSGSEEAMYLRLQPSLKYVVQQRNNRLELGYAGDYVQYFEEYCRSQGLERPGDCLSGSPTYNKASYQNHGLSLNGFLEVSRKLRARLVISQRHVHQPLGTGQSARLSVLEDLTSPDAWNRTSARAEVSYGAYQARGEIRAGITFGNRRFDTERTINPDDLDKLDERSVSPDVSLLYRLGNRTQIFGGLGQAEVRDASSADNSDRDISRQFVGVEFDSSAITSGSIRFSNVTEDFIGNRRDLEYVGWDLELTWRPRRYSTVTIGGGKVTERGLFNDDIGLTTKLDAEWVHFWRERFSTRARAQLQFNEDVDRFSPDDVITDAEDESLTLRFEGNYNIRRWLDIGAFVVIDTRDGADTSAGESRDYERTLIGITANGTI